MFLTSQQLKTYQEQGFVLVPNCFSQTEVHRLKAQVPTLVAQDSRGCVMEKESNTVRALHGSHTTNEVCDRFSRHARLVNPAMQLVDSSVYIHQFKINIKAAFSGDVWVWHQDYIFWHKEDGLPTPRITSAMILLDEMNEFNGPLFVVPRSHHQGMIDVIPHSSQVSMDQQAPSWSENFSANLKYSLEPDTVKTLADENGIVAIKGSPGSVLFFDSNIVHASPNNISPFDRCVMIITYNSTQNPLQSVDNPRPNFLVSRDNQPIEPLPDEAFLLQLQ